MIRPIKGIKKQVLGGVLLSLGAVTALLAVTIGFELDSFYVVISIIGAGLFLYGTIQRHQHKLASQSVPMRQGIQYTAISHLKLKGESMKNQRGALTRRSLALLLVIAVVSAVAITAFIGGRPGKDVVIKPPAEIEDYLFWQAKDLTGFKLMGADAQTFGLNELKGKWSFIFFGYTHCPDVCPLTMGILGQAFKLIEKTPAAFQEVQGVFISVDPKRDTPELLKEYVSHFSNKFTGVTGDTAQLDAVSRQMSALYTIDKEPGKPVDVYQVTHSSTIFLVDPQGRLYGRFPPPLSPHEIAGAFINIRTFYNERVKK